MLNSSRSSNPKPGRWTILATWALVTISLSACQSEESPMGPTSEVLELDPVAATLVDGDTLRIQALSKNGNGSAAALDPSSQVTWESSAPEVAVVEEGLIRGVGPGEARITAVSGSGAKASANITVTSHGMIPAFPGAEGWGATALNECRSKRLQVLTVTNTDSTGQGSFDQALQDARSDRFTFILFRTGGVFRAPSGAARLNAGCVYIAGQTAPADGFVVTGAGLWLRGSGENISDVVVRHLRFRGGRTHINISKGQRIVLDHLSSGQSSNHLMSILRYSSSWSQDVSDVSIQNSILSEALAEHPTAFNIGAQDPHRADPAIGVTNLSIHRNLFAHNSHRNPLSAADNALIANNVLYNWNQGTIQLRWRGTTDVISNFGKEGPMTMNGSSRDYRYMVNPHCASDQDDVAHSIYVAGNIGPLSSDPDGDNWSGPTRQVACYYKSGGDPGAEVPDRWRRDGPQGWADVPFPVTLRTASEAYAAVLRDAGANAALACDGEWVSARDSVDARVVSEVKDRTGISNPLSSAESLSSYRAGSPCADVDGDGLPDAWEVRFFGCATCANPAAVGRGGYLVIEHYLNGTDPR
jgi:pectate lyase